MRIRWQGGEFAAKLVAHLPGGNMLVEALEHGARFAIGTHLEVKPDQIVSQDTVVPASPPDESAASLQKAMDAERETLPPVSTLLAEAAEAAPENPSMPSSDHPAAAKIEDDPMMSDRLTEKLRAAAGAAAEITAAVEARADALIARKTALLERSDRVFSLHEKVLADSEAGLDAVENALRQLSNS